MEINIHKGRWIWGSVILITLVTGCGRPDPLIPCLEKLHAGMTVSDVRRTVPAEYVELEEAYTNRYFVDRAFQTNVALGLAIKLRALHPPLGQSPYAWIHFGTNGVIAGFEYIGASATQFRDCGHRVLIGSMLPPTCSVRVKPGN